MHHDVHARFVAILSSELELPSEHIRPECLLIEDLGVDSLDLVSVAIKVEDEFKLEVEEAALRQLKSVADVVSYLSARVDVT
jgi:acyl carrier protein